MLEIIVLAKYYAEFSAVFPQYIHCVNSSLTGSTVIPQ